MTEDDTFNRLKRVSLPELQELMQQAYPNEGGPFDKPVYFPFTEEEIEFVEKHYWTELNFKIEWKKLHNISTSVNNAIDKEIERLRSLKNDGR